MNTATNQPLSWMDCFLGNMPGAIGEGSTLLICVGMVALLLMRVISWRIICGILLGATAVSLLFNVYGSSQHMAASSIMMMPFYWHFVLGGFAFGTVFMATDPLPPPSPRRASGHTASDRLHGRPYPRCQSGISGGHDACDPLRQHVRPDH